LIEERVDQPALDSSHGAVGGFGVKLGKDASVESSIK